MIDIAKYVICAFVTPMTYFILTNYTFLCRVLFLTKNAAAASAASATLSSGATTSTLLAAPLDISLALSKLISEVLEPYAERGDWPYINT